MLDLAGRLQHHALILLFYISDCISGQLAHVAQKTFLKVELYIRVVLFEASLLVLFVTYSLLVILLNEFLEVTLNF